MCKIFVKMIIGNNILKPFKFDMTNLNNNGHVKAKRDVNLRFDFSHINFGSS